MNRLVVISNRVADLTKATQAGGLAVALADALKQRGGVWVGWNGTTHERLQEPTSEVHGRVRTISLPLTQEEYDSYYVGFSNGVLWPLFHYRLDLVDYQSGHFKAYWNVSDKFAELTMPFLEPDDMVWVQDYHLIPLAACLRRRGGKQRMGFFLHTPFPPPDMLAASPHHAELVDALLQYDLVGFQTHVDAGNFRHYLAEIAGVELLDDGGARTRERVVEIERFPIGIDAEDIQRMARETQENMQIGRLRRQLNGRKLIVGVDRLDYSKGLPERFSALERLFDKRPEWKSAAVLLQIAPPTREDVEAYSEIRMELEGLSGAINGRFAQFNWMPIQYIHRTVPRDLLASIYRTSHVGLVTPLRDGMNLVAKEYLAAQDPDDPGVLVLSQFAGAAEELTDALIVNPYDTDDMATKLHDALSMPLEERRRRHTSLLESVREYSAAAWMRNFLARLEYDDTSRSALPEADSSRPPGAPAEGP